MGRSKVLVAECSQCMLVKNTNMGEGKEVGIRTTNNKTMRATVLFLICFPTLLQGQIIIWGTTTMATASGTAVATTSNIVNQSPNTDLKNTNLVLAATATDQQTLRTTAATPLSLNGLTINSKAPFAIVGDWTVANNLIFTEGNLVVSKLSNPPGKLSYQGGTDLAGSDISYVNGPLFMQGQGSRTFPIGNSTGYFPVRLESINATDATIPLSFEMITTDPGFTTTPDIKGIFTDHFWQFTVGNASTLSSSTTISLSSNQTNSFFTGDGDAIILEKDQAGAEKELGGSVNNTFFSSSLPISATGKQYALAKGDVVTVRVHKLITPDNDQMNDVLVVEGIDSFPDNEVTLLDRWGVPFKTWKGFVNYPPPASSSQDFDFSKLAIGNYVCVVKYSDHGATKSIKQMISVLK
jgi:CHU_C Type IX secretion signal domain